MTKKVSEGVQASGYRPTTIVGLARGGWIPARLMCDLLGITDLISLKVEHWLQTGKTKDEATIRYPLTGDLKGKKLLVVDDITDTGKSLMVSLEHLKDFNPEEVRVATMQYLPQSKCRPDYFAEEIEVWTWFIYPWNWIEDTSTLIVRLLHTAKEKVWALSEIRSGINNLFEIEWDEAMLNYILEVMVERKQVDAERAPGKYRLVGENVIEL